MSGTSHNEKNPPQSQHLLADLFGIEDVKLSDPDFLASLLKELAAATQTPLLGNPQIVSNESGCQGFQLLKNGHVAFQTYPAANFLAVDICLPGNTDPEAIFEIVKTTFASQMVRKTTITRGLHS